MSPKLGQYYRLRGWVREGGGAAGAEDPHRGAAPERSIRLHAARTHLLPVPALTAAPLAACVLRACVRALRCAVPFAARLALFYSLVRARTHCETDTTDHSARRHHRHCRRRRRSSSPPFPVAPLLTPLLPARSALTKPAERSSRGP